MKSLVILFNLGGPLSTKEVRPFLRRLFRDPEIIRLPMSDLLQAPLAELIVLLRSRKVIDRYRQIGGGSPQLDWTNRQAEKLVARLRESGEDCDVTVAMRYSEPFLSDTLQPHMSEDYDRLIWLPLYPQKSDCTTGAANRYLHEILEELEWRIPVTVIEGFHHNAGFYDAWANRIKSALDAQQGTSPTVLFSAHSVPMRLIDAGDAYRDEIEECVRQIVSILPERTPVRLGYQSRSGPVRWLGPDTLNVLKLLGEEGAQSVIVCPLAFVSDHIETLHEIDIEMAHFANQHGITRFSRCESLNDGDDFIETLTDAVTLAMKREDVSVGQPQ